MASPENDKIDELIKENLEHPFFSDDINEYSIWVCPKCSSINEVTSKTCCGEGCTYVYEAI
jgi:hypothetical protein